MKSWQIFSLWQRFFIGSSD